MNKLYSSINNAYMAKHLFAKVPFKKKYVAVLNYLMQKSLINHYHIVTSNFSNVKFIIISLKYVENKRIFSIEQVSKTSKKYYLTHKQLLKEKACSSNLADCLLLSTDKGICDNHEARVYNLGGKILCRLNFFV